MKQLKQSPVAKIIAWILITVSALMLLAGTAGAYAISELGFYTRSVEDIREEQFERIAGKYSARVLLNLNNTENETYFKDTNFRYGVVEAQALVVGTEEIIEIDGEFLARCFADTYNHRFIKRRFNGFGWCSECHFR